MLSGLVPFAGDRRMLGGSRGAGDGGLVAGDGMATAPDSEAAAVTGGSPGAVPAHEDNNGSDMAAELLLVDSDALATGGSFGRWNVGQRRRRRPPRRRFYVIK